MLYTVLFSGQVIWGALIPLLPGFGARFHLTSFQIGVLLAASSVTTLVVSLPAGMLAHRLGPRQVTLAGIALMVVSDVGQATASSYLALVGARAVFGAAFGIIWTAGVAWLLQVAAPQAVFASMVACNLAAALWLRRARSSAPPLPAGP